MSRIEIGCPECAKRTGGCGQHGHWYPDTNAAPAPLPAMGWVCPRCSRVYSPTTVMCVACGPKTTNAPSSVTP